MTRKKSRKCISDALQMPCPYCSGEGKVFSRETILLKLRKNLQRRLDEEVIADYLVKIHPAIAELICENTTDQDSILPRRRQENLDSGDAGRAYAELQHRGHYLGKGAGAGPPHCKTLLKR